MVIKHDKIKYTWLRALLIFMINNKWSRSKVLLYLFQNHKTHIMYLDGKEVGCVRLKEILPYGSYEWRE